MSLPNEYLEYPQRRYGMDHERYDWSMLPQRKPVAWPNGARVALWIVPALEWFPLNMKGVPFKPPGDEASDTYPLILVTGRRLEHYNVGTMTRRTGNLELLSHDVLEIHPDDAAAHGIADGALVEVRSRNGSIQLAAHVTDRIEAGHVFTAFHFPEVRTNLLIGQSADINTSCPEYKVVAVAVTPVVVPAAAARGHAVVA